ncbi:acylphosphatase [Sphingosinicella terrae]|uniref:acylphosphatase n=1 Tax=Sphingosinicella terrae TaxID=2172047 RepID=UPI000E0DFB10|nr:acylphosphatase [Sphingosinicella terrae]
MAGRAKRLRIHGRVQGVFYRAWTVETARGLGLAGWVRNRADGTVELVARGEAEAIERLIALCREGPPAARVERIVVEAAPDEPAPEPFEKRPTA